MQNNVLLLKNANGVSRAFNTSTDEPAFLRSMSSADMTAAITEYEETYLKDYWERVMLLPVPGQNLLGGFQRSGDSWTYFRTGTLQAAFETELKGPGLLEHIRSVPLAEQARVMRTLLPRSRKELNSKFIQNLQLDLHTLLAQQGDPTALVQLLCRRLRENTCPYQTANRSIEFLVFLWDRGWTLFPISMVSWVSNTKWKILANPIFAPTKGPYIQRVAPNNVGKNSHYTLGWTHLFFAITDVQKPGDISSALLEQFQLHVHPSLKPDLYNANIESVFIAQFHTAVTLLTVIHNAENPSTAITPGRVKRPRKAAEHRRVDGQFRWLATARPELIKWADMFRDFVAQLQTQRLQGTVEQLNAFGDFLCTLTNPPLSPAETSRTLHIKDVSLRNMKTFSQFLKERDWSDDRKNDAMAKVRRFFDWASDFLVASGIAEPFANPITITDSQGGNKSTSGQTKRNALPDFVLQEMKDILTEDDFAFARKQLSSIVTVVDSVTGNTVAEWSPGFAVCLYMMLELPLRSHQARWLDSGALDEFVYDPATNSMVANSSPYAIPGRKEGVLRLLSDGLRNEEWLGIFVNTNKTAIYDGTSPGRVIPYLSTKAVELLNYSIDWEKRYLTPITQPVDYFGSHDHPADRSRLRGVGPTVAPLFRDPLETARNTPLSYHRLSRFYTRVLEETQLRIEEKYGQRLCLVEEVDGKVKWLVDMHSLRVSGITQMLENGVPLEIISEFIAGHQTLAMTVHYTKFHVTKIRQAMADALEKRREDNEMFSSETFLENLDSYAPFLLGQKETGTLPEGIQALKEKTGILSVNTDGICPGTSCDEGGPTVNQKKTPVPGGRRCGLCKFWLTGPSFLLGQVAEVNNLAYIIRKKGLEVKDLNDKRLDAEDAGKKKLALQLRDRVEILNREVRVDIEEWVARYRYAEESIKLLSESRKSNDDMMSKQLLPILSASDPLELKVTLEQAHEFVLLDQITQSSEFLTGFANREAALDKNLVLTKMMAANGLQPFLINLSEKEAHDAGNLLSSLLIQQVSSTHLQQVLTGEIKIEQFPELARTLTQLSESSKSPAIKSDGTQTSFIEQFLSLTVAQDE